MDSTRLKRQNFTVAEGHRFDLLVKKYFHIINNKNTDGPSFRQREATWDIITTEFNSQGSEHRTLKQLRARFDNLKRQSRPRPLTSDPLGFSPKINSTDRPMALTTKIDDTSMEEITIREKRQNFTTSECHRLDLLVKKYFHIINTKSTDGPSFRQREATWDIITTEFNSQGCEHRTLKQLRSRFENLKRQSRPRPLISDPLEESSPKIYSTAPPMAPITKIEDMCTEDISIEYDDQQKDNFVVDEKEKQDSLQTEILMKQRDEIDVRMRQQFELHELAIKNERLSVTKKLLEIKKLRLEIKLLEKE